MSTTRYEGLHSLSGGATHDPENQRVFPFTTAKNHVICPRRTHEPSLHRIFEVVVIQILLISRIDVALLLLRIRKKQIIKQGARLCLGLVVHTILSSRVRPLLLHRKAIVRRRKLML